MKDEHLKTLCVILIIIAFLLLCYGLYLLFQYVLIPRMNATEGARVLLECANRTGGCTLV
jgi:hypothetical protein